MATHDVLKRETRLAVPKLRGRPIVITLAFGLVALGVACVASITVGAASDIDAATALRALFIWDGSPAQLVVHSLRLPRVLVGALAGANLAVAGALIQGVTRNPLAEPSIIGVNAGATLIVATITIVSDFGLLPWLTMNMLPLFAFGGAALAGLLVYSLASKGVITPVRLALAGVAVATFFQSLTMAVILTQEVATQFIIRWMVGSVANRTWEYVQTLGPWAAFGLAGALLLAPSVTVLSLGDDVARGLGQHVERIRLLSVAFVVVLAGAAVAVCGPIAMVGLLVPHAVRRLVGVDYRAVIPCSAVYGALLLVVADIGARLVAYPAETPVGVLTAMIGVPVFIALARREGR